MQNVQKAAEIQQRVINLVELYRTKVGKESQIAKAAKEDYDFWKKENEEMAMDAFAEGEIFFGGMYGEGPHTEVWIKHLKVNEQLLGHFYSEVAGDEAEKDILDQLLPEVYDTTIFSEEEEAFLKAHFKEMVNYIIQTPCDETLEWVHRSNSKYAWTIPAEVLNLIKSRVGIAAGSRIYYPNTAFAQLANVFGECKFYCDTVYYSWTRIAIYANNIDAVAIEDDVEPTSYNAIVCYLPEVSEDSKIIKNICEAYNNLPSGGKLILLCPPELLARKENSIHKTMLTEALQHKELPSIRKRLDDGIASEEASDFFRRMLVEDKAITEIIQLPQVMSSDASFANYCLLIAEKGYRENIVSLIDARSACSRQDTKHHKFTFDIEQFSAIMRNDGKEPSTGLRKVVHVSPVELSKDILVPQVYVIEKPSEAERPVPLSSLCTLESMKVRDVQFDLPEDTPWITMSDLTPLFTGNLDMTAIRKADCPNNPPFVEGSKDYAFDKDGKFIDSIWNQMYTTKGHYVLDYRKCTFLDGSSDAVLYERSAEHGVRVAVVRATGKPYAVSSGILVFCPKDDFDANSLAALLRLPIVYRQLVAYQEYGIGYHLDEILVPTDKRLIGDELYRMKREESVINELGDKVQAMKTEYINEVRMRKHDIRPHLRQLASSERLMLHYIDNANDMEELKRNLRNQIEHSHVALTSISMIVDHLSDEEQFGVPELLNIDSLLTDVEVNHNDAEGFVIEYDCDKESFRKQGFVIPNIIEQWELAQEQGLDVAKFIQAKSKENLPLFVSIAPVDFQRMVDNIIENARRHGFTDKAREDYCIGIVLSYNSERAMYQIDFTNNGNPLPEGMTKARYGIKGDKAGLAAGSGSGGYIVKSIVNHYDGDYDVFCKDGITTVRILLPIVTI